MSALLMGLSAWAAYVFVVHTLGGQRFVVRPLLRAELAPFGQGTLHVVWHIVTWDLALGAVGLGLVASGRLDPRWGAYIGLHALGAAAIFLLLGRRRTGSSIGLPQWLLLGPLGLTAIAAALFTGAPARAARLSAAAMLAAIALVHLAWVFGSRWPASTRDELYGAFVGVAPAATPARARTLALLTAAGLGALAVLLARGYHDAAVATGCLLGARGLVGFIEPRLRPGIQGTTYARLGRVFYWPLCLGLAALALCAAA